jgi:hypothetical protein
MSSRSQSVADGLTGLPLGDVAARRSQKRDDAVNEARKEYTEQIAPYFDRAVEVYLRDHDDMKAAVFADMLGVDATHLSRMRSGERNIDSHHLRPLRRHKPSAAIVLAGDARISGLAILVRRDVQVSASEIEKAIVRRVLRDPTLRRVVIPDVADELGIDPEDALDRVQHGDPPASSETPLQHAPVTP